MATLRPNAKDQDEPPCLLGGEPRHRAAPCARDRGPRPLGSHLPGRPGLGHRHLRLVLHRRRGGLPRAGADPRTWSHRRAEAGSRRCRARLPLCLMAGDAVRCGHGHRADVFRRRRADPAFRQPARRDGRHLRRRPRGHGHHLLPLWRPCLGHLCPGRAQPRLLRPSQGAAPDPAIRPVAPSRQADQRPDRRRRRHFRHLRHGLWHRHVAGLRRVADEQRPVLSDRHPQHRLGPGRPDRRGHGGGDPLGHEWCRQGRPALVGTEPDPRGPPDGVRSGARTDRLPVEGAGAEFRLLPGPLLRTHLHPLRL